MEIGRFITCRENPDRNQGNAWKNMRFNSREYALEPGPGLLTVKRVFKKEDRVCSVKLRVTALGVFEALLNGERIVKDGRPDELAPLWTDYHFRVMEFEYDLTELAKPGENTLVFRVSGGWWSGKISFGEYGYKPYALCAEIEKVYDDGRKVLDGSGEDWDAVTTGPVLYADIWNGEYDDMTVPDPAQQPEKIKWVKAAFFDASDVKIVPFKGARVCVNHVLRPTTATVWEKSEEDGTTFGHVIYSEKARIGYGCEKGMLKPGQHRTIDFGQNMVGRPVLRVKASKKAHLYVFFAEMLNDSGERSRGNDGPRGSIYIENYRSALARYECILPAGKELTLRPLHTFYGFRYIEIMTDQELEVFEICGEVVGSSMEEYGDFTCSDAEVNKLFQNTRWGMRGNYLSVPTDCPQRDERLGWTGDTEIFCTAAAYLADIHGFMEKWLLYDAEDSQVGFDGAYSDVIPRLNIVGDGVAAWGDAGIIVPWKMYLMYGDTELLRAHYASMEYYMRYLEQFGFEGPKTSYGDWLNYEVTDKRYVSVCYYAYDALLMRKISEVIGKTDRAAYYESLRQDIIRSYFERYVKDGEIQMTTQTGYLLPVAFEMVTGEDKDRAVARLKKKIEDNDYTLSTGFLGTGNLNQTLSLVGLDALAYSLLLQTKDPSWLYSVRQGATTIWERWNSYTLDKGFGAVGMNSFNHYAYGSVAEWLFGYVLGIRPDPEHPGFEGRCILGIRPDFRSEDEIPEGQKRITSAAGYTRGYVSEWSYRNGRLVWHIVIPTGQAKIEYPVFRHVDTLEINGITMTLDVLNGKDTGRTIDFELDAGDYWIGGEICGF
ncbi:MAG: family 78 glycoside hydrolase catalytic domain [Clostridia bacterium]|nr:family 78 glycoside hydrolase catalytic domain [Clostridia bacterium]